MVCLPQLLLTDEVIAESLRFRLERASQIIGLGCTPMVHIHLTGIHWFLFAGVGTDYSQLSLDRRIFESLLLLEFIETVENDECVLRFTLV